MLALHESKAFGNDSLQTVKLQRTMKSGPSRVAIFHGSAVDKTIGSWSLLCGVLLLAAMACPFFAGRIYAFDDLGAFHLPLRWFYATCLRRGESFDWLPHLFGGFYLSGEGQVGTYHPLHWLLYRWGDFRLAFCFELLSVYPFMWAGAYLFLRRLLGRPGAALWGSLVFSFGSFNLLHFMHLNAIAVVAHIGWLLWAIDLLVCEIRGPSARVRHRLAELCIVFLTASQLLLGYPQYVWFSLLAEASFFLCALSMRQEIGMRPCSEATLDGAMGGFVPFLRSGWQSAYKPLRRWVAAKMLGGFVGAVQLAATFEQLQVSARQSVDAGFRTIGSMHPLNIVQIVAPYLFAHRVVGRNTHELGIYLGAVPVVLIAWWFWNAPRNKRRAIGYAAFAGGVFALMLAFGRYTPLYSLQGYLPVVGGFRCPSRYSVLFQLSMAVLASIACCELSDRYRSRHRLGIKDLCALALPVVSAMMAVGVAFAAGWQRHLSPGWKIALGPLLLVIAAWLTAQCLQGRRGAFVGLVVFTTLDLGVYGLSYAVYRDTVSLKDYVATVPHPPGRNHERVVYDLAGLGEPVSPQGNRLLLLGRRRMDGYAGLPPSRHLDYHKASTLQLAAVRWVRNTPQTAGIDGLYRYSDQWLEVPSPLPRVRWALLVGDCAQALGGCNNRKEKEVVERFRQADQADSNASVPNSRRTPRNDKEKLSPGATLSNCPNERPAAAKGVALVEEKPGYLRIRTKGTQKRLLVVADSFHPGWNARIDGRHATVVRVAGDFIGCWVPSGQHEVVFHFHPAGLYWGKRISLLGFCLALAFYGFPSIAIRCR